MVALFRYYCTFKYPDKMHKLNIKKNMSNVHFKVSSGNTFKDVYCRCSVFLLICCFVWICSVLTSQSQHIISTCLYLVLHIFVLLYAICMCDMTFLCPATFISLECSHGRKNLPLTGLLSCILCNLIPDSHL